MPSSNPPPDRFQREIDDIIRLAERRLEHQSFGHRMRRQTRKVGGAVGGLSLHLPSAETLGGLGLAFLMLAWFFSLGLLNLRIITLIEPWIAGIGILLLVAAILSSIARSRGGGGGGSSTGGGSKTWRGERISYGNPYGEGFLSRIRRMLRGRS
jgi:hypothetical protein